MERAITKLAGAILTAAILALAAWVYTIGNRVTALETRQEDIAEMRADIREIRNLILSHMEKTK